MAPWLWPRRSERRRWATSCRAARRRCPRPGGSWIRRLPWRRPRRVPRWGSRGVSRWRSWGVARCRSRGRTPRGERVDDGAWGRLASSERGDPRWGRHGKVGAFADRWRGELHECRSRQGGNQRRPGPDHDRQREGIGVVTSCGCALPGDTRVLGVATNAGLDHCWTGKPTSKVARRREHQTGHRHRPDVEVRDADRDVARRARKQRSARRCRSDGRHGNARRLGLTGRSSTERDVDRDSDMGDGQRHADDQHKRQCRRRKRGLGSNHGAGSRRPWPPPGTGPPVFDCHSYPASIRCPAARSTAFGMRPVETGVAPTQPDVAQPSPIAARRGAEPGSASTDRDVRYPGGPRRRHRPSQALPLRPTKTHA